MPDRLYPTISSLINVQNLDWITHDTITNTIMVQTSNTNYVGSHKVILMQSFQNFPDVYPFTSFVITINPQVIKYDVKKAPYFESPLSTQTVI